MDGQQESQERPIEQEEPIAYTEQQLGQLILSVKSRIANKKNNKGEWEETGYKEIFSTDVTTAFLDDGDLSVLRNQEELLSMIKSFAESNDLDMEESYNLIANCHNGLVISSKATGKGAKIAKSQFVEQKFKGNYYDERRKKNPLEEAIERTMGKGEQY